MAVADSTALNVLLQSQIALTSIDPEQRYVAMQARGMLVGSNGRIIGMIGIAARRELEHLWRMRVHLFLQVSVKN